MIDVFQILVGRGLTTDIIRGLFCTIDAVVYGLLGYLLQLIFDIANVQILKQAVFDQFANRLYQILGIFMLFKLAVSFLGYIVNPDLMVDKEKGMSKLITRVVVVIVMFAGLNAGFALLSEAQSVLYPVLPKLIIGRDLDITATTVSEEDGDKTGSLSDNMNTVGKNIAWTLYQPFFTYNVEECPKDYTQLQVSEPGNEDPAAIDSVPEALGAINDECENLDQYYKYNYTMIIPTVIGIFIDYVLLLFCIQIAIRSFKMLVLRLIAPIPIISYIDPKSAKDGAFSSWIKTLVSTWLELFLTLGVLYFIIYIISSVIMNGLDLSGIGDIGFFRETFVTIALIIGLFMFAKDAPMFISKALGLKGLGLGMAWSGAMGGLGTLRGGGSLRSMLPAAFKQMNESSSDVINGKPTSGSYGKGKEAALKLSGKESKSVAQRAQDWANRHKAIGQGVSEATIKDKKDNKDRLENLNREALAIQNKVNSGVALSAGEKESLYKFLGDTDNQKAVTDWEASHGGVIAGEEDIANIMAFQTGKDFGKQTKIYENMVEYAKTHAIHQDTATDKIEVGKKGRIAKATGAVAEAKQARDDAKANKTYSANKNFENKNK